MRTSFLNSQCDCRLSDRPGFGHVRRMGDLAPRTHLRLFEPVFRVTTFPEILSPNLSIPCEHFFEHLFGRHSNLDSERSSCFLRTASISHDDHRLQIAIAVPQFRPSLRAGKTRLSRPQKNGDFPPLAAIIYTRDRIALLGPQYSRQKLSLFLKSFRLYFGHG